MSNEASSSNDPELIDLTINDEVSTLYEAPSDLVESAILNIIQGTVSINEVPKTETGDEDANVEPIGSARPSGESMEPIEEEPESSKESEPDISIVEEEITVEELNRRRIEHSTDFLSWFHRLKPEQFVNFDFNTENYKEDVVNETPVLELDRCKDILEAFKDDETLEDIVDKFGLENEDLALVAVCIGAFQAKNASKISFTTLCEDRIDEWTMQMCEKFLDQPHCGPLHPAQGPLKLMQFTMTTPSQCILLLTIIWLRESGFPCPVEFEIDDGREILSNFNLTSNGIVESAIQQWREKSFGGPPEVAIVVDDFFRELEVTHTDIQTQLHQIVRDKQMLDLPLAEEIEPIQPLDNLDYMDQSTRDRLTGSLAALDKMKVEMAKMTESAKLCYQNKSPFSKFFKMLPGDFCLARDTPDDAKELVFARVVDQKDQVYYRVKFLDSGVEQLVSIADLAMLHENIMNPLFNSHSAVGLRVAVLCPIYKGSRELAWYSGTVAARNYNQQSDYLVFIDTGIDDNFTSPTRPGDPGYHPANRPLVSGTPWTLAEVREKVEAAKIVLMMGQAANERDLDRTRVALWHRDKIKADFIHKYMKAFPEWPLLKMTVGTRHLRNTSATDKSTCLVTSIRVEGAFAWIRYQVHPSHPGATCMQFPCTQPTHRHRDEKIYRGSTLLVKVSQQNEMLTTANNLSQRRRNQIASQFDLAEANHPMPIRTTQTPGNEPRGSSVNTVTRKPDIPKDLVESRMKKQNLYTTIVNKTPVLKPLQELKFHEQCGPDCLQDMDSYPYDAKFHRCSPLHVPLMSGWRRLKITMNGGKKRSPFKKLVMYYAPCGRPMEQMSEVVEYLNITQSQLTIDCFSYDDEVETETFVVVDPKYEKNADFADGHEGIPIPVVNSVDEDDPPKMEYSKRRFQYDPSVNISSINKGFCSGCTCVDDCSDPTKCECMQLSMQEMRLMPKTIQHNGREQILPIYQNRVLYNKVITGVYECNDNCPCKRPSCHNRVVQNNIKYPMQIFKTAESGWGVRALTDIPQGAFICNYVGALLTNDLAEELKNEDQYFADLDLKDAVETNKIREDHDTDMGFADGFESDYSESDEASDREDNDAPVVMRVKRSERNMQTRQTRRQQSGEEEEAERRKSEQPVGAMFNWDDYFMDTALYVVDAKQKGNLGRFLNHSCDPNVMVQHVMYDTHDLRLPWVSFFTTRLVKAGQELCWDYGYTVMNTIDERLACHCGAENCRRRLL